MPTTARDQAEVYLARFTAAAAATGAIPVPATSLAIVAENAALLNAIGSAYGVPVTAATVVGSMGPAAVVNTIGRAVFVEGARALGWFTGPLGLPGVIALGAATAGLQTWCIGQVAIAVCERGGSALPQGEARAVLEEARRTYADFERERQRSRVGG